jgi:hypothetical protein
MFKDGNCRNGHYHVNHCLVFEPWEHTFGSCLSLQLWGQNWHWTLRIVAGTDFLPRHLVSVSVPLLVAARDPIALVLVDAASFSKIHLIPTPRGGEIQIQ